MARELVAALLLGAACAAGRGATIYVDRDATGSNNGTSWQNAYVSLSVALVAAGAGDEVWVAEGTYKPFTVNDYFPIDPGVKVFGGFAGTESDRDNRDPETNLTVLDGDLNGDDEPGFLHRSDNCRNVVRATLPTPGTVLDGFVVKGGYAVDNGGGGGTAGGGLWVGGGSMRVARCVFIANGAESGGGAAFIDCEQIRIDDCVFSGNSTHPGTSIGVGGGIFFAGEVLDVQRTVFLLNLAQGTSLAAGGAVIASEYVGSVLDVSFRDCEFVGNLTTGGLQPTGGACSLLAPRSARLTRCTFHLNRAGDGVASGTGGALYATSPVGDAREISLVGCRLIGNSAGMSGSAVFSDSVLDLVGSLVNGNSGSVAVLPREGSVIGSTITGNSGDDILPGGVYAIDTLEISDSVLWGNTNASGGGQQAQVASSPVTDVSYSCVEGWDGSLGGSGSFGASPRFVDTDGADGIPGTLDDDYRLRGRSPCIDSGDNTAVPPDGNDIDDDGNTSEKLPLDLDLNPRRLDDTGMADSGAGNAPFVDMGAYEFQGTTCAADYNGDGVANTLDVILFLGLWASGDAEADFNGDGSVNTLDVLAFLNAWTAGC